MKFIKRFEEIRITDVPTVGGKNASLGEMIATLSAKNVRVPSGFAILADGYWHHVNANNLLGRITDLLKDVDKNDVVALQKTGKAVRELITQAPLPADLADEIRGAYRQMQQRYGEQCDVAVRSSATAEDLPEASFAGQQDTFLNVRGADNLVATCPLAYASLFTDRAISYRIDHHFNHLDVALSIGVQKMVRSDQASAGVLFTLDTESGFRDVIFITASYGLGENVVKGTVNPDEFYVHKPTLSQGFRPILKKRLGSKSQKLIYQQHNDHVLENVPVSPADAHRFSLTDDEILELAHAGLVIEEHYSAQKGSWLPMDVEWAKDGIDGKIYVVQARPETVHAHRATAMLEEYSLPDRTKFQRSVLVTGKSIGSKIATGRVRVVADAADMAHVQAGDILVTTMTDPDWEPIMKRAAGIVTNRGGRTCHAAIVSRELGIPAIVGATDATDILKEGQVVTLDCSGGEVGVVYEGAIPFEHKKIPLDTIPHVPVKIMMNLGNPDEAFRWAQLPCDGVGLARLEFIIASGIQIHPMALVHPERVVSGEDRQRIAELTAGYADKKAYFVDTLAQEAGTIAAAFYPKPVIVRLSDFKSNEYRALVAGKYFEPEEENPMIGFRGAARYDHPNYEEAFALECAALAKIRGVMGLKNVQVMVPFVRTVAEGARAIAIMKKHGLERGRDDLKVIMMCEIPSNVLLIDQFSKYFDGFSIGSNDLTQFTLAVDRDSALVAPLFDERDDAVKMMLRMAIEGAKRNGKHIGICGQAPSDYPEIAELLTALGIDAISLNPDTVLPTIMRLGKVL